MKVVTNQAEQVCSALKADDGVSQIDITIIITIITTIIQLLMNCNKSDKAALDAMKNPGIFHRWTLRSVVNDTLEGETRTYAREVAAATLKAGNGLTLTKVRSMFSEVRAQANA